MKNVFSRIFCTFMAVLVLISSTGFGLIEHSCTVKGKRTSLHKSESACCNKIPHKATVPQKTTVKKVKCCSEQEKYENVDFASSASQNIAKFVQSGLDWVKITVILFVNAIVEGIIKNISSKKTSSSPPSGRQILILIQSFLI